MEALDNPSNLNMRRPKMKTLAILQKMNHDKAYLQDLSENAMLDETEQTLQEHQIDEGEEMPFEFQK